MSVLVPGADAPVASKSEPDRAESAPRLRKGITGKLLFFFVLGDVLGAGIYALVGEIAGEVGGAIWLPMLVALGLALLTAGSYAELVTKYPKAGGSAVFAEHAYRSDLIAFLVGYCMLAAGVVSAAGLSIAFSGDYLKTFVDVPTQVGAVVFLLLIAALNARGIRESMRANVIMTCIELTGLLIVIAAAAVLFADGGGEPGRALEFTENETILSATFAGTLLAFYSFVGFETTANVAEEIKDPSRVYPRALFGALVAAGVMYALIGVAASTSLPVSDLAASTGPLLSVVDVSPLNIDDRVFSLIALIAVANGALLTMIMSSRLTYGMSVQGNLPRAFSYLLPVRCTPLVAIATTTAVAIALTFLGDLATLAETVVLLLLFVFLSTNIAVLVLRRDEVDHDHFRVWSFVPVLAVFSCVVLLTQQSGGVWLRGLALVAVGGLLFAGMKLRGAAGRGDNDGSAGGASIAS
jgi:amino acid transporter